MKILSIIGLSLLYGSSASFAETLQERSGDVYNYDVLFTNPTCKGYKYDKPVETQDGSFVSAKPKNVFCTRADKEVTTARTGNSLVIGQNESPKNRLMNLINAKSTSEIYMSYLSFSDREVFEALCDKLKKNELKLTLILDAGGENRTIDEDLKKYLESGERLNKKAVRSRVEKEFTKDKEILRQKLIKLRSISNRNTAENEKLEALIKNYSKLLTKSQYLGSLLCSPSADNETQNYTAKIISKQKGIGWSHTKVFMVNPYDKKKTTVSFSSANMSSGTTIHHENWHFATVSPKTHFAQMHICLKDAELDHSYARKAFVSYLESCRKKIGLSQEEDIKVFIAPGEGEKAIEVFTRDIKDSQNIALAAHRFTLRPLVKALKEASSNGAKIKMVFDDDMYLVGEGRLVGKTRVPNMKMEYTQVLNVLNGNADATLGKEGVEARYMQTNHFQNTIHHNKYLILDNANRVDGKAAVFCGAGNFTKAAFSGKGSATNLENYYYITIPAVVEAFNKQYDYKWNKLATPYAKLPLKDSKPITK